MYRVRLSTEATLHVTEALDAMEAVSPTHHLTDIAHSSRHLIPRGSCLFHQVGVVSSDGCGFTT